MKELIEKLEEYNTLLSDELSEVVSYVSARNGWKSSRYEKGIKLREEISLLKIQALSQSEGESKIYDIDFNGHILARIEIINNKPTIIASMNGYGNAVDLDKITITPQTK